MNANRNLNVHKFLGVISDTHAYNGGALSSDIKKIFEGADGIIHAGDLTDYPILQELEHIATVWAVYGNMDTDQLKKELPERRIIEWEGKRIGVIHGAKLTRGDPRDILPVFVGDQIDCLIFGHSHQPFNQIIKGILCFNPGSPAGLYDYSPSIGTLRIEEGKIIAEHIVL
ncbi:MAG: YfcE family phosphodiesterase [Elusimicrobia bacterium]|nr:YfcE family phosphodiesterase [Elusimicrobiota bacterium]